MRLYYIASQTYQFSYSKPIYQRLGGTFLATSRIKQIKFRWRLRHGLRSGENKAPKIELHDDNHLANMRGIILSQTNRFINGTKGQLVTIFMGHGTGDKKYGGNHKVLKSFDYHFISGPKHLAKLADVNIDIPEDRLIKIGNPRFDEYLAGKIDKNAFLRLLGVRDLERETILYAPTWRWGNGSLQTMIYPLAKELNSSYNLIVRPHHHDHGLLPKYRIWAKLHGLRNVYFSNPDYLGRHDIMNVFAASDLLITDASSTLYEYLITGKPIVQVQTESDIMHNMPDHLSIVGKVDTISAGDSKSIAGVVARNLGEHPYRNEYRQLLEECFYLNGGRATDRAVDFIQSLQP